MYIECRYSYLYNTFNGITGAWTVVNVTIKNSEFRHRNLLNTFIVEQEPIETIKCIEKEADQ